MLICSVIISICFLLSGCNNNAENIRILNDNFNGEYKFTSAQPSAEELEKDGFVDNLGGFGCTQVSHKDGLTEYGFSGYPDTINNYKVTSIVTKDPKYEFYGFSIGDFMSEAHGILKGNGYKPGESGVAYILGNIRFNVFGTDNIIEQVSVYIQSTNKMRIVY